MYSDSSAKDQLISMDESLFYSLLEGPGKVEIDVTRVERYFIPVVSFFANDQAPRIRYGAIVRNKTDVLGAESMPELLALLGDLCGRATNWKVLFSDVVAGNAGAH